MAAIHTPALVSSFWALTDGGPNPGRLGGFLALALAMLFFISKIRGVRALEFATHRRSVLTIAIAVVLIHADAIGTYLQLQQVPATVPVAATTLLATGLTSVQEAVGSALSGTERTSKRPRRLTPALGAAWFGLFGRHRLTLVACLCAPRAPPA